MKSKRNKLTLVLAACLVVLPLTRSIVAQTWAPAGPAPRSNHSAILDTSTNRMVVFGGLLAPGTPAGQRQLNDVWRLSSGLTWSHVKPSGTPPAPRGAHSAVYDPISNRMIIFGGGLGLSSPCENDVWVLTYANGNGGKSEWIQLNPSGGAPAPRLGHSAVFDPNTDTMIAFGGDNCFGTNFADVWILSDANGVTGTTTWKQLSPAGTPPSARVNQTAVYDPSSNRMIVFAGYTGSTIFNDVWVLSNANGSGGTARWTKLSPSGTLPVGRTQPSAVYDAINNRMIVFGGSATGSGLLGDLWVLSNANGSSGKPAWSELAPSGILSEARTAHTAVYNPSTNKMTIFGGLVTSDENLDTNDIWVLSDANGK